MQKLKISEQSVGIGIKSVYYDRLLDIDCAVDFCEAHIENFISGGFHLNQLKKIANKMAVTLHGVALSLGGQKPPSLEMLAQRKQIINIINPVFVSEHVACTEFGQHLNDLLPIALNQKNIKRIVEHIDKTQVYFQRQILVENLTSYVVFDDDDMHEGEFLNAIAQQSGCGLLLDVNNLYLQEYNLGRSADMFLQTIKPEYIQQYHLAGGEYNLEYDMMIDTHGTDIQPQVMDLYSKTIDKIGNRPTLYERDNNIPEFDDLLNTVQSIRQTHKARSEGIC